MIEISGGRVRRRDKRIWFVALGVFAAVALFTFLSRYHGAVEEDVEAASLANFDPGFIISDYQMGNYTSMTEAEIQAFLSAKGNCRDTNIGKANSYPHLSYHIKDGHFVCLAEEVFGDGIDYGDAAPNGESAAHIIWQAAQDYKINPQVILVLLQKEQSLITDSWPNNVQYRSATGYGCPDTAACSTKYYGFKNQVRNAAGLFRTVLDGGWTNYPLGNNYVQYNPNAACGGSVVNIRSLATSALYRYTPYQPNAGALAAGYGTATCGAYGNRNFYLYFQDWFGGITVEKEYEKIEPSRYLVLKNNTTRINPLNNQELDDLSEGMIRKYSSKVQLDSMEWCLRTEASTQANSNSCVKESDLSEIVFEYEAIDEEKIITPQSKKIALRQGTEAMTFSDYIIRHFTKKTTFLDTVYYITEYDEKNNQSEFGIKEGELLDSYEKFDTPEEYMVVSSTERKNPFTGKIIDRFDIGRVIKIGASIELDGTVYYQTEMNNLDGINAAVLSSTVKKLSDYEYQPFISPREMVLNQDVKRINPLNGHVYDVLSKGRVIKFSSKILVNGTWFYRTENNTINNINAAIPSWAAEEKR